MHACQTTCCRQGRDIFQDQIQFDSLQQILYNGYEKDTQQQLKCQWR